MLHDYYWFKKLYSYEECQDIYQKALLHKQDQYNDVPGENKNLECFGFFSKCLKKELDKFFRSIYYANREAYGFDLYKKTEIETCSINLYDVGKSYGCHRDARTKGSFSDTKLTAILNISTEEYTGGEFIFHFGNIKHSVSEITEVGDLLIFPSFWYHEVTPILSGKRISLSAWITGPNWK